jgi:PAS domain S-box-containing protein
VLGLKQLQKQTFKILSRNSDGYDIFDFRVGTLIGTSVLIFIPVINYFVKNEFPDLPHQRNALIFIQFLTVYLSYHLTFIKKWANEIGNVFSLMYAIIVSTATYLNNFEQTQTIYAIITLVGITGMFKMQKMMTGFIFLAASYFLGLVWLNSHIDFEKQRFISLISILLFSTGYYVFFIKLDYVLRLKKRENQLVASESWFRNIFDNTPVGIIMLNDNYKAFKVNQYFQKITGYTEGEVMQLGLRHLIHPDDYMSPEVFRNFLKTENAQIEQRIFHKSGQILWVRMTTSQMTINDKLFTISMFNDISVERLANLQMRESSRQLKAQNESLEEFSYVISHDLQEPLRMITAFSQFIQRRYVDPLQNKDATQDFKFVIDGAKRMSTLIKDMREYTKWSAQSLPVESVNVREVLLVVQENLTVSINQNKALIRAANLPILKVNRLMLVQVFQNLISNAIKYRHPMRQPEIQITVMQSDNEWLFTFQDNGIGFEDKHKDRIFGIFQRLNNDRVTGNGIGLAICKRIIEKQGGKIWAESVVGEGSTFCFSFPVWDKNNVFTEGVFIDNVLEEEIA